MQGWKLVLDFVFYLCLALVVYIPIVLSMSALVGIYDVLKGMQSDLHSISESLTTIANKQRVGEDE